MRNVLLTIFWVSNIGNVMQSLIMIAAGWLIVSDSYSFLELTVVLFVTDVVPWLRWIEVIIIAILGDFGRWILSIPILVISPIKFVLGALIGWWAYTTAKKMPVVLANS